MNKTILGANINIIRKTINSRLNDFKLGNIAKSTFFNQMRLLNELERKVAIELEEFEYANFIKEIIDEQTLKIHKVNSSLLCNDLSYVNSLTLHDKVNIITTIMPDYYDSINDPYEVLTIDANNWLIDNLIIEVNSILKKYNISIEDINKIDINDLHKMIKNKQLYLDILYISNLRK